MQTGILKLLKLKFLDIIEDKFHFDIYVKNGNEKYTLLIKKDDKKTKEMLRDILSAGHTEFYIDGTSLDSYNAFIENVSSLLTQSILRVDIDHLVGFVIKFVRLNKYVLAMDLTVSNEKINRAAQVVEDTILRICNDSSGLLKIFGSVAAHPHITTHAVSVAMLSVLTASSMDIESTVLLEQIATGAICADAGMGQLTFNPEEEESLSPEQRKELWRHPEMGKFLLDRVKGIPPGVVSIVMQHHERPNGHGYPNGLRSNDITMSAKIVSVADSFTAMVSKRSYRDALFVKETLKKMKADTGKFDSEVLGHFFQLYS